MKSIGDIIKSYKKDGVVISPEYKYYKIENARDKINYYFQAFLAQENKVFRDHKEYDEVAEWLEDSYMVLVALANQCWPEGFFLL